MISVIIPTYNASRHLPNLLNKLKEQTIKDYGLIIIDSSSEDNTIEIAKSFGAETVVIPREQFDHGGTRTMTGKKASGDILAFLTQDVLPADKYSIENLIRPIIEDEKVGAAYGKQIPYNDTHIFGKHLRYFNYPENSYVRGYKDKNKYGIKIAFLSNSFAAYKKSALEEIGWFKENLILGEDTYAGAKLLKADYKIAYVADATVYHSHNYTVSQEFRRYFDIGVFHKMEEWIIREFGKAEGEGKRYIKSELSYLLKNGKYHLMPEFIIRNGLKFFGYRLGQNYKKLPKNLIKKFSMYKDWWAK